MEAQLSSEAEEYIEAIYRLQRLSGVAKTKDLAIELHVVPGSITNTIAHLERHGLVEHTPYRGVKLTPEGQKLALGILRRHRLAERLLTDILGGDWSEVHEGACRLEHALTDDVLKLIERSLEDSRFCPHGNPIPTEEGDMEDVKSYPLTEMDPGEPCIVVGIADGKREKLSLLAGKGIVPQASVSVVKCFPKSLILRVANKNKRLSNDDASSILVRTTRKNAYAV